MLQRSKDVLRKLWPRVTFEEPVSCHHNYVAEEHHFGEDLLVTRKGAISARQGERRDRGGAEAGRVREGIVSESWSFSRGVQVLSPF